MEEKKYNAADITKKLGLGKTTILRWEHEGKIPEAKRDRLGWRYWNEKEFNDILAIAGGKFEERAPTRSLNIDVRLAQEKFLRQSFLPELSKDRKIPESKFINEYGDNNFREIRFGAAVLLAALVFFGSSSLAGFFAGGFKNSWLAFERGFEFSTSQLNSSGAFLASEFTPFGGRGKIIDRRILLFFSGGSNFLGRKGVEIKNFYMDGGTGLWEGALVLKGKALEDYFRFAGDIKLAQVRSVGAGEILENFARDSLDVNFAFAISGAPDMLSGAAGISFSLRSLAGNSVFAHEIVADWEFIAPDVKALPRRIFDFYAMRTRDAVFAARGLFTIGSYLAINIAEWGAHSFNNLGGNLALAETYPLAEFLLGR